MALAEGKASGDPQVNDILLARAINQYLGVQMWPWEVEELPEDLLITLNRLMHGLPKMQKDLREVEDYLEKWRNSHPTYRRKR